MTHEPVPQRLSDAERDAAAAMLREHFEAGRLDATEFDERLSAALAARYATDFAPLFGDLPDPRPGVGRGLAVPPPPAPAFGAGGTFPVQKPDAGVPAPSGGTDWIGVARGVIWPAAIVLAIFTGNWGLFIIIAIIGSIALGQIANNQRKPPPYLPGPPQ